MTDEARAREVVKNYEEEFDVFGGMKQRDVEVGRDILTTHITAAFAQVREEIAALEKVLTEKTHAIQLHGETIDRYYNLTRTLVEALKEVMKWWTGIDIETSKYETRYDVEKAVEHALQQAEVVK